MAPFMDNEICHSPSRTEKYKKVLKPLLERRRRARINSCLDELKGLLADVSELDGDNNRLEKADILELAVTHLRRLKQAKLASVQRQQQQQQQQPERAVPCGNTTAAAATTTSTPANDMTRYRAGFSAAATVVSRALASVPGVDVQLGSRVMQQLGVAYQQLDERRLSAPLTVQVPRFITRVPVVHNHSAGSSSSCGGSSSCVSPADSCSSGYSSCTDSGLLTVAREHQLPAISAAESTSCMDLCSRPPSSTFSSPSVTAAKPHLRPSAAHCQSSPLNLVAGEEDMWRPW